MNYFPYYKQHDAMQCGVACLQMVCKYFGNAYSQEELSDACSATNEGVSLLGISNTATELGLHAICGKATVDTLQSAPLPCVLHWDQNHFVVLYAIKKDWKRILERAYVYNYAPLISTKRPLRREDVIYLKEIGVKRIQISLDSVCPDELSKMLKVNYSYANEMMNTFHYCNEIGLEVDVRTVLTKMNVAEQSLNNLFLFLESMACVTSWVLTPAFVSAFKEDYESYQADEQQLIDAFRLTKNKKTHLLIYHNKMSEKRYSQKHFSSVNEFIQNNQTCYANSYAMSIISNGKVTVCEMLYENEDFLLGDINKQNIAEIWNSSEALTLYSYKQEFIKRKENNSCCSCSVYEKCKTGLGKKVCYVDVTKIYGNRLYEYPDPRCPRALEYDRKLFV